tara:strand:- start:844 stop:1017 length:174 start_codon:yes stop_codon:yes gene_type:complete
MKTYSINFTQKFEETRNVLANSEEEAEQKIRNEWESAIGAEVKVFSINEIKKGGKNE